MDGVSMNGVYRTFKRLKSTAQGRIVLHRVAECNNFKFRTVSPNVKSKRPQAIRANRGLKTFMALKRNT
jgi:hypothetical protein